MKTGTINHTEIFNASPTELYQMFMDKEKHSEITGSPVRMSPDINGHFDVFDGYCHGFNIDLLKNKKIVQAWHFAEEGWPKDHYSTCTFVFEKSGKSTKMTFTQTEVPEHKVEELEQGWDEFYWERIRAILEKI